MNSSNTTLNNTLFSVDNSTNSNNFTGTEQHTTLSSTLFSIENSTNSNNFTGTEHTTLNNTLFSIDNSTNFNNFTEAARQEDDKNTFIPVLVGVICVIAVLAFVAMAVVCMKKKGINLSRHSRSIDSEGMKLEDDFTMLPAETDTSSPKETIEATSLELGSRQPISRDR